MKRSINLHAATSQVDTALYMNSCCPPLRNSGKFLSNHARVELEDSTVSTVTVDFVKLFQTVACIRSIAVTSNATAARAKATLADAVLNLDCLGWVPSAWRDGQTEERRWTTAAKAPVSTVFDYPNVVRLFKRDNGLGKDTQFVGELSDAIGGLGHGIFWADTLRNDL